MKNWGLLIFIIFFVVGCNSPQAEQSVSLKKSSSSERNYIQEGLEYLKKADAREAIKSFDEGIRNNPLDSKGYIILGQTYMRLKDYSRAVDTFAAGTRIAPDSAELHYLLALNQGFIGDTELAIENAQKSADLFREKRDEENFKKSIALLKGLPGPDIVDSQHMTSGLK